MLKNDFKKIADHIFICYKLNKSEQKKIHHKYVSACYTS